MAGIMRVVSDGYAYGTKVLMSDGTTLDNVVAVYWTCSVENPIGRLTIVVDQIGADCIGDLKMKHAGQPNVPTG